MKNLLILVKMQLKEQMDFKRFALEGMSPFKILMSVLTAVLKFALVTALCAAFLLVCSYLKLFSGASRVPTEVISIVFSVMLAASLFSCTIGLTRSLYFARDNAVLITLPCRPVQVYVSKLIIFFLHEVRRSFTFVVPLFVAYFLVNHRSYGPRNYLWFLLCILLISLATVAVGSLLSIPAMYLGNLFRQYKTLQSVTLAAMVALLTLALFRGIALIPENIDLVENWPTIYWQIQDFLNGYAVSFPLLYGIAKMMLGETVNLAITFPLWLTVLRAACVLAVAVVFFAASMLLARPLFYKMASKPFEHLKRHVRAHHNHVLPRRISAVWMETLMAMKSANRIFFNIGVLIGVPMLTFLQTKIFLAMKTRDLGNYMVLAFNVLIILLVTLNANTYAASVFSRDGRSAYLIKTQPAKYIMLLQAKLIPNTVFGLLSLVVTCVILYRTSSIGGVNTILLMLGLAAIYLAHLTYCAELDLMNPQNELYASMGASDNNPNETKATATAFLISFGTAGVIFLLMLEKFSLSIFVKILVVGIAALVWRVYLFQSKIKVYYKEK